MWWKSVLTLKVYSLVREVQTRLPVTRALHYLLQFPQKEVEGRRNRQQLNRNKNLPVADKYTIKRFFFFIRN